MSPSTENVTRLDFFFLPSKTHGGAFALLFFSPQKRQKPQQGSIPSSHAAPHPGTSSSLFQPGILQPVWGPPGRPPTPWHQSVRVNWQFKYLEGKQPLRKLWLKPAHIGWLWGGTWECAAKKILIGMNGDPFFLSDVLFSFRDGGGGAWKCSGPPGAILMDVQKPQCAENTSAMSSLCSDSEPGLALK